MSPLEGVRAFGSSTVESNPFAGLTRRQSQEGRGTCPRPPSSSQCLDSVCRHQGRQCFPTLARGDTTPIPHPLGSGPETRACYVS